MLAMRRLLCASILGGCALPAPAAPHAVGLPDDPDPRQPRHGLVFSGWTGAGVGMQLHVGANEPAAELNGALQVGASAGYSFEHVSVSLFGVADVAALPDTGTRIFAGTIDLGAMKWQVLPLAGPVVIEGWVGAGRASDPHGHGIGPDLGMAIGVPVSRDTSHAWVAGLRITATSYFSHEPDSPFAYLLLGDAKTLFFGLSVERIIW